jgi:hypothetical protein
MPQFGMYWQRDGSFWQEPRRSVCVSAAIDRRIGDPASKEEA